ncbi:MAG: hypothetical protein P8126_02635 [Gammaproteobacteria bacterium]|jgi:hypothetical protein
MNFMDLIDELFKQGLGELPVFYSRVSGLYLGNMVYERGKIYFKDNGLLAGVDEPPEPPDWNRHLVGMVCYRKLLRWESLSFFGLDYCELQSGPDPGFANSLKGMQNQYGDDLYYFIGSIYRAYYLMLDNGLLPVVLLHPINPKGDGHPGLAIGDLKSTYIGEDIEDKIRQDIRRGVERQMTLTIEEITENEIT